MKKIWLLPVLFAFFQAGAQSPWKQELRYQFHVAFHPAEKSIDARMTLQYTNRSPDTLSFIWFHIWPNSYRNDRTPYTDQLLENGDTRFYFSTREEKGYLNRLEFRVDGIRAVTADHPEYIDIIKLMLPKPLLPGDHIEITSSYHLRLPFDFNGAGYRPHHFEFKNWYPEPAVYDKAGWHPMPLLIQGGAYREGGDFDVEIEVPHGIRIASGAVADTLEQGPAQNRYHFILRQANAFAWIADSRFLYKSDSFTNASGAVLRLQYFYLPEHADAINSLRQRMTDGIRRLSAWLVPYPQPVLTLADASLLPGQSFSGLLCLDPVKNTLANPSVLRKQIAEQWFQGLLLTNARDHPWMSEGFVWYYNQRLADSGGRTQPEGHKDSKSRLWLRVAENEKTTQPISTSAPVFSVQNDSLIAGYKASLRLKRMEDAWGVQKFDHVMSAYISHWRFQHPDPEDFIKTIDSISNRQPGSALLNDNASLFAPVGRRPLKPVFLFSAKQSDRYNNIGLAPAAGYNRYDGFMLGALIHNLTLPENRFEFIFSPLYAFHAKTVEGLGTLRYTAFPGNRSGLLSVGVTAGRFASNQAKDSTNTILFENWSRIVPYIRFEFRPPNARSTIRRWVDFKSYLIWENSFDDFSGSSKDSLIHPNSVHQEFRYVNQLRLNFQDDRTLYPYRLRIDLQQSETFYRINLDARYFLNYPDRGGLEVRFFASKFGVWNTANVNTVARYEPKLLGVNGEEDYLYENYFVGRSASDAIENASIPNGGIAAQQIMNRDGGLKLRADAYDYVQGRSGNWVSAVNFNTTLPAGLFPFPLPVRLFFDVGTYAEAWQANPQTSRFLYTAGVQLSLFDKLLNVYAPIFYSSDFKNALGNTSFGKKITFSIDIQRIHEKKIIRKLAEHE